MHYFIDGYNLMFRLMPEFDDFMSARHSLIEQLNRKAGSLHLQVTLVFDSQYQAGEESRTHFHHVEIIFSNEGETADECILRALKLKNSRQTTVVTSDKKLAWFARRCEAKTVTAEAFVDWLERRYRHRFETAANKARKKEAKSKQEIIKEVKSASNLRPVKEKSEHNLDYYLEEFEKRLEKQEKPVYKPTVQPEKQKKKSKKPVVNEMQRWEQIFKDRLEDDIGTI